MSLIVDTFVFFDINPAAKKIFCSNLYNRKAKKQGWECIQECGTFVLVASYVHEHNASH